MESDLGVQTRLWTTESALDRGESDPGRPKAEDRGESDHGRPKSALDRGVGFGPRRGSMRASLGPMKHFRARLEPNEDECRS